MPEQISQRFITVRTATKSTSGNMPRKFLSTVLLIACSVGGVPAHAQEGSLTEDAQAAMKRAATFFQQDVAVHGGYVYFYSLDLKQRWGEGLAGPQQIWIQPPGTPTVGLALLAAYEATGDEYYLAAATDAALAVCYGQLQSGGWTNSIEFDPESPRTAAYRNGQGHGRNHSSLDDGQTQAALRLLMHVDQAYKFANAEIHSATEFALEALLQAQFKNGGFPQVWTGPVEDRPILAANFPEHDWRTEGRIKNYWDMYTLNDNVCGEVADTLIEAHKIYGEERYMEALQRLGDFLILAQLPEPQPGWAQQYNEEMQPIWARKFEPAAVAGDESQEAIATLMKIAVATGDKKYLQPIPAALDYLQRSLLPDGRLARFYELRTNKPLYMQRNGDVYTLTYDDSDLPSHYRWKWDSKLEALRARYDALIEALPPTGQTYAVPRVSEDQARQIIQSLDKRGRWVSTHNGQPLIGQAKIPRGAKYLSSDVFSRNLTALAAFVSANADDPQENR